jgi:hypothetical protein
MFVCVAAHWWRESKFELKLNKKANKQKEGEKV